MGWKSRRSDRRLGVMRCWAVLCLWLLVATAAASEPPLSQKVYDQLIQAQELTQQEQHQQALVQLQTLSKDPDLSPYETALTNRTLGYVYAALNQFDQAASVFQKSLASQALPPERAQNLRYKSGSDLDRR